uniref:Uncharacterized protein n=1 Tax=Coralloluteibacterium stylophorae TaxID=1776034 RepID=A0A8J8AY18_9GAMM
MSRRWPLDTLLRVRGLRADRARQALAERIAEADRERATCTRIEGEIIALQFERDQQRARLLDPPPAGGGWPAALAQREAHVELLGTRAAQARQRLFQAQDVLRAAMEAVAQARAHYLHLRARLDALEQRRQGWRGDEHARELRAEEAAAADLVATRHPASPR